MSELTSKDLAVALERLRIDAKQRTEYQCTTVVKLSDVQLLLRYVQDLETRTDPAGDIRRAYLAEETAAALAARVAELERSAHEPEVRPFTPMDRDALREKIASDPDPDPEIGTGSPTPTCARCKQPIVVRQVHSNGWIEFEPHTCPALGEVEGQ